LFGILVEGLADRFEPALCDVYVRLFSQAAAMVNDLLEPASLVARYERVRRTRPVAGKASRIFVLSRVTLGADVAVTSVVLSAAKRRFPNADIVFVGPRKNYELFARDPRLRYAQVEYRRGSLRDRLAIWEDLQKLLSAEDSVVLDPDSRLTQLGILPVCSEERYHLFESRSYGSLTDLNISELAAAWAEETLGVSGAKPYVALPKMFRSSAPYIAVSLGVGENAAKRLPDPFEEELLKMVASRGVGIWIDRGAGGEEALRVAGALERAGIAASVWNGSFASFAVIIAGSRLYVGYDSAGQHVATACEVPQINVFAGFCCPRFFDRWRAGGPQSTVIRVDEPDVAATLERVKESLEASSVSTAALD
jgi:ADP-heptose:LPS heptosyltransferase